MTQAIIEDRKRAVLLLDCLNDEICPECGKNLEFITESGEGEVFHVSTCSSCGWQILHGIDRILENVVTFTEMPVNFKSDDELFSFGFKLPGCPCDIENFNDLGITVFRSSYPDGPFCTR